MCGLYYFLLDKGENNPLEPKQQLAEKLGDGGITLNIGNPPPHFQIDFVIAYWAKEDEENKNYIKYTIDTIWQNEKFVSNIISAE